MAQMELPAFFGAKLAGALAVCLLVPFVTGLITRDEPLARRKLLIILWPLLALTIGLPAVQALPFPILVRAALSQGVWFIAFFAVPAALLRVSRDEIRAYFLAPGDKKIALGVALILVWGVLSFGSLALSVATGRYHLMPAGMIAKAIWPHVLASCVFSVIFEEWYARGVLWSYLPDRWSVLAKAAITSLLLTAQHLPWDTVGSLGMITFGRFIAGIAIGVARGTAGVRYGMVLHGLHNFGSLLRLFKTTAGLP